MSVFQTLLNDLCKSFNAIGVRGKVSPSEKLIPNTLKKPDSNGSIFDEASHMINHKDRTAVRRCR